MSSSSTSDATPSEGVEAPQPRRVRGGRRDFLRARVVALPGEVNRWPGAPTLDAAVRPASRRDLSPPEAPSTDDLEPEEVESTGLVEAPSAETPEPHELDATQSSEAAAPTEPVDPDVAAEPVEPTEPIESTGLAAPVESVELTDQSDLGERVQPAEPTQLLPAPTTAPVPENRWAPGSAARRRLRMAALATVVGALLMGAAAATHVSAIMAGAVLISLLVLARGSAATHGTTRSRGFMAMLTLTALFTWAAVVFGERGAGVGNLPAALAAGLVLVFAQQLVRKERTHLVRAIAAGAWAACLMASGVLILLAARYSGLSPALVALIGVGVGALVEFLAPARTWVLAQLAAAAGVAALVAGATGTLALWQPGLAAVAAILGTAIRRVGAEDHERGPGESAAGTAEADRDPWWPLALAAASLAGIGVLAFTVGRIVLG